MHSCSQVFVGFPLFVSFRKQHRRRRVRKRRAFEGNGTEEAKQNSSYVEMTVASDDFNTAPTTLRVPDPVRHKPRPTSKSDSLPPIASPKETGNDVVKSPEGVQIQRSTVDSSLHRRNRELAAAHLVIQSKDKEVKILKQSLSELERLFEKLKVERISYRQKLESKDCQLTDAYQSLVEAAEERSQLHQELFEIEQELLEVRRNSIQSSSTSNEDPPAAALLPNPDAEEITSMVQRLSKISSQFVEDALQDEEDLDGLDPESEEDS